MGVCPMEPQQRIINDRNKALKTAMKTRLEQLSAYGFPKHLLNELGHIQDRYLYSSGIIEDLQKMQSYIRTSILKRQSHSIAENLEEEIRNSCLILQNQANLPKGEEQGEDDLTESFQHNMKQNGSLVAQINIIYSKEIDREEYGQSLKLFLKWAQMFQQHSYGGFLKPIYSHFCSYLYGLPKEEFQDIIDEVSIFVQFLVAVMTEVYSLQQLATYDCGKLIKNENIYNLIMSIIFKRTKMKRFLIKCITQNDSQRIDLFEAQLKRFGRKPTYFFGISKKFTLQDSTLTESEINKSIEEKGYVQPYAESLKLVNELCKCGTPITKLKTIINISKEITKEIHAYYEGQEKESPELDPDNLSSIIIYLIVKNGSKDIYEELKIVEHFTTSNCLNCISGYYLNVFIASIESIITLQQPE